MKPHSGTPETLNWETDRRMQLHSQEKLSAIWNNQTICLQHSVFSNWRMVKWMKEWLKRQKSECHFNNPSELTTCPHGCGVPHFGAIVISIFMNFDPYKHSYCVNVLRPSPILHFLLSQSVHAYITSALLGKSLCNYFQSFQYVLAKN